MSKATVSWPETGTSRRAIRRPVSDRFPCLSHGSKTAVWTNTVGDFSEALAALLGPKAIGLSTSTIVRLKEVWQRDYAAWNRQSLADKCYVDVWVDGIHFTVRLDEDRQDILVVMDATQEGKKELVAVEDGLRESGQSWGELLLDLKARGHCDLPKLVTGDGAIGS